ncbi:family 43 glycosylhydrolase [Terracidiphilus gabretensis]|uniref:family 43 glycosylhydrolase n=1 Tax=Terracidiphilus gabretensis TaxID=1577687 RepID=UPI00071C0EAE|nr:family 43 glycosylhydrolase [Terracidiphilus gabretensis]
MRNPLRDGAVQRRPSQRLWRQLFHQLLRTHPDHGHSRHLPPGGIYSSAQTITITDSTPDATIYYTIDGTTPSASSTKYGAAISVSTSKTITAMALASGYNNSPVALATFTINSATNDLGTLTVPGATYQYQITNAFSGMVLGINGQSQVAGTSAIQETNTNSTDSMWHYMPFDYTSGQQNGSLENMLTHQVLGISGASTAAGAAALQWADNGTKDHLWQFYLLQDGNYLIKNVNSGLYLEDTNSGTTPSAAVDQNTRSNCTCQEWALTQTSNAAYSMPLTVSGNGASVHDPNMLKDSSGTYWLYGTHQTIAYSTDMTTFTYTTATSPLGACTTTQGGQWLVQDGHCPIIGPDFASWTGLQTPASDNNGSNTDIWAPDVMYANSMYYQYYAIPVEPDTVGGEAIIGLAISTTPSGPWKDAGFIISSWSNTTNTPLTGNYGWNFVSGTTYNAIDPSPFIDADGNWWLVFGSFYDGTHLVQLDPATGQVKSGATISAPIAFRYGGEEGPFIYPWVVNGTQYYYYFASANVCCSATSAYRIIVGRSTSPTGPFVDHGGLDLSSAAGGTILLSTHTNIVGPGGESVFTDTVNGTLTPTLVYHYYNGNANGAPTLGINRLGFTSDGWPYVE